MWIIGCDFHSRYQQIAAMNLETGELVERRLCHEGTEVQEFYASLPCGSRVGVESTTSALWFAAILQRCGHELWVGDAARIRAATVRKQKTDTRDALLILELLRTDRFPRIWRPSSSDYDLRQLLWHRHKLVAWRTQVRNQLSAMARSQGLCSRRHWNNSLRCQLQALPLDPWSARRRSDLLHLLDQLTPQIEELTAQAQQQAQQRPAVCALMQFDGVGPIVGLSFLLTLGTAQRFPRGKQVASYLGLNPSEHSSGGRQKLGHISKQGNSMLRSLLVEAAWIAVRKNQELRRVYQRLAFRRGSKVAVIAVARKLAVKLYWRLREFEQRNIPQPPASMQDSSGRALVHSSPL
jgi:transposase